MKKAPTWENGANSKPNVTMNLHNKYINLPRVNNTMYAYTVYVIIQGRIHWREKKQQISSFIFFKHIQVAPNDQRTSDGGGEARESYTHNSLIRSVVPASMAVSNFACRRCWTRYVSARPAESTVTSWAGSNYRLRIFFLHASIIIIFIQPRFRNIANPATDHQCMRCALANPFVEYIRGYVCVCAHFYSAMYSYNKLN